MPKNRVLQRPSVQQSQGRSDFDRSFVANYTALAGQLGLAMVQPVVAGTKGVINRKVFTRTAKVVSPAFQSVTEHFDFFIVPLVSLWSMFENWKLNLNDAKMSSVIPWNTSTNVPDMSLPNGCPRYDFSQIISDGLYPNTVAGVAALNDACRLLEYAGYGKPSQYSTAKVMNLFKLAAYQKVYFEHYRNTSYESNNPYAFNLDWLYQANRNGQAHPSSDTTAKAMLPEIMKLRRVNYRNDYFHNIYPTLDYVVSLPHGSQWSIPSNIVDVDNAYAGVNWGVEASAGGTQSATLYQRAANFVNNQTITAQSIRALFALDKLLRASAYAPKHVSDQYKARFGVDVAEDNCYFSRRLGSFQSDILFPEVTNMANTSPSGQPSNLGDIGGKGIGQGSEGEDIHFYAERDSIILCMHYIMPRASYDSFGVESWNTHLVRESFFQKEFQNLGLRPIYGFEIDPSLGTHVVGYTVPNQEYKLGIDRNYGPFKKQDWEYSVGQSAITASVATSPLRSFVVHTNEIFTSSNLGTANYFKVSPEDLDYIFEQSVDQYHRPRLDQFYGQYRIKFAVVAPMDVHGQPSL